MSSSPPIEVPDGDEAEKADGPQPPKAAALTAWRFCRDQDCVLIWLVVWHMNFIFYNIIIIPTD